jgi:Eukaryotic aspartyl protease
VAVTPRSVLGVGAIPALLGDSILRSAYVVFDLANERIGLAQAKLNATDSNVVPFASSGAPIPSATSVAEVPLTYTVTGTAAVTSEPIFVQTAPFFSGSAAPAFASAVAAGEAGNITATVSQSTTSQTGNPKTSNTPSAGSTSMPLVWHRYILLEAVAGLFAIGFAIIM